MLLPKVLEKKLFLLLQVPSETKPTLHLVCAVRPQTAAQLGARPKVFFLLFILGLSHVAILI